MSRAGAQRWGATGRCVALLALAGCAEAPPAPLPASGWPFPDRPALEIAVTDPHGEPLAGAWVTLLPTGRDAVADPDGVATFPSVEPGPFEARVAAPGFEILELQVGRVDADRALTASLTPSDDGARVVGAVVDPYGQPVPGARIEAGGTSTTADGDGAFTLPLSPGLHTLTISPPGQALGSWTVRHLEVQPGATVELQAPLPGRAPPDATHVGSTTCLFCHSGTSSPGARWLDSAHSQASRTPAAWSDTLLAAAFEAGTSVSLDPDVPGARVQLASPSPGQWTAEILDVAGGSTGPLEVLAVYGGHRAGAALVAETHGERVLLPLLWALDGHGLSEAQHPAGFLAYRAGGWFDGTRLVDTHGPQVAFDLQCAGCHATGHRLVEAAGFSLVPAWDRGTVEDGVGCEACHGPGSAHVARPSVARRTIHNPGRAAPADALQPCARCHERRRAGDHPFSSPPGWPVLPSGDPVPADGVSLHLTAPAPDHWATTPGSRVRADQVGELRLSPHRGGPSGWEGACWDCHDPHGSPHPADLRRAPGDNGLCTDCHASRFPSVASQRTHAAHARFALGPWQPGTCVGCHMPRSGHTVRPDALSGAGELRSHVLWPIPPADVLDAFDAAGEAQLPPETLPVGGCLDCHLQAQAARAEVGADCDCPVGDPGVRSTWEMLAPIYDGIWP